MRTQILLVLPVMFFGSFSHVNAHTPITDSTEFEFCGYESPMATPAFVVEYNRVEKQRIALGYTRVCDRILQSSDLQNSITPWKEILPQLGFTPVDLGATPFAQFELIGGVLNAKIPAFAFLPRTDHVTRVFRRKDGVIISLEEWDLTVTGGGVSEVYRKPDVLVKSSPGYWVIIQAKSGKAYSSLWWQGATRKFDLTINTNLQLTGGHAEILRLAESVPPDVPAGTKKAVTIVIGNPGELSRRPIPDKPDF